MRNVERIIVLYPAEATAVRVSRPGNYSLSRLLIHLHARGDVPIYFLNQAPQGEQWGNIQFIHLTWSNFAHLLARLASRNNTLIVQQMGAYHRHARLLRAVMPGSRILVRLGGVYYKKEYLESPAFERERRVLRRQLAGADMVISTADGTPVNLFMEKVGVGPERYRKWLNGFPVIPNDTGVERGNRIVCISRLHRGKLIDCVVRAFASAFPRLREPHTLRIVGDGPERDNLGSLVKELGVRELVEFVGHSDEVGPHLYSSKLLVSGLTNNPVMEAIATGTPVITAEWGEMRALYGHLPNVHVVDCPRLGFGPGPAADLETLVRGTADRIVDVLNDYPRLDPGVRVRDLGLVTWEKRLQDELDLCDGLFDGVAQAAVSAEHA